MKKHLKLLADALFAAKQTIQMSQHIVSEIEPVLDAELHPLCEKVIEEHNSSSICKIQKSFRIVFSGKDRSFILHVRIDKRDGRELDEDFMGLDDPEELYGSKLRPIMERELLAANLPLVFGGINVPSHYFCK
ncbi:MAG: hypothetical protein PHG25_03850 [Candidatus Pacebacteria bacterium]|nr:hypothetical protein [Candidatus Paceibacterota bacterium]